MRFTLSFNKLTPIKGLIAGLIIIALILIAAAGTLYVYGSQQKLPAGFTISGWPVGGMPYAEFDRQWQQQLELLRQRQVLLRSPSDAVANKQLPLGELGLVNKANELEAKLAPLKQGSIVSRAAARWKMRKDSYDLANSINTEALSAAIKQNWQEVYKNEPVQAKRVILDNDSILYVPEHNAQRIHIQELQKKLEALVPQVGTLTEADLPLLIQLTLYEEPPPVTANSLKEQGIARKITEFSTVFPASGAGRIHNIRSTAASLQDMLLKPGDIFDYAALIKQTEAKFGYQEAPVIVNGKLAPGIGGGICQVSTTLYNAILRVGLEVVERRNHSLPISYAPLGQDATFADGYINFKFRNNTGKYLLIRTQTTDRQLTVKLFGDIPAAVTYDVESKIIETLQPPVQYVHNAALKRGSSQKLMKGKAGYVVETYRITKENGAVIKKELISKDRYSPEPVLIATNNGPVEKGQSGAKQPGKSMIEDGIKGPVFQ
ncbi:VanW family protein [Paenibacillus eucommiae]|uniref:Vancomycin resistance protein YoaR n=1 Tax=Paenibacillus eucommiae TaxID=1355755 RepID=A0ABS4J1J0_9BACL|nr:VanW family protein [Paenibacillus eucommiae]MBP1992669.1 vancomycin resistance protein YoaR [Paenibacillus eucommiae]